MMKKLLSALVALFLLMPSALAQPFSYSPRTIAPAGAPAKGDIAVFDSVAGKWIRLTNSGAADNGKVLTLDNTLNHGVKWSTAAGSVTSVGISGPTGVSWSNTPVTSSGTLTGAWANQSAGTIFGNFGSSSAAPSFNAAGSANTVLGVHASNGSLEWKSIAAGRNVNVTHSTNTVTLKATSPATQGCRISIDRTNPIPIDGAGGTMFLVPNTHGRIALYTSNNEWVEDVVDPTSPPSFTVPATTNTTYDVYASDTSGNGTITLGTSAWTTGSGATTTYGTGTHRWLCLGPDNNIWSTKSNGDIVKTTPAGVVTAYTPATVSDHGDICVGADGNLWFTYLGSARIGKITTGGSITEYTGLTGNPSGSICLGPDGNVWFTMAGPKVAKMTTSGTVSEYACPSGTAILGQICAGPDGNVWVVEKTTNKVAKITPSGSWTEYSLANGPNSGICATPDGNLWVGRASSTGIYRITPSGNITEFTVTMTGTFGTDQYFLCGPDGKIYSGQGGTNGRISIISPGLDSSELTTTGSVAGGYYDFAINPTDGYLWTLGSISSNYLPTRVNASLPPARGQQDGVWWTGNAQQRLIGCIRTGSVSGVVPDNAAERYVYNWDNQVDTELMGRQTVSTWTYNSTTLRAANANTTNGQGRVSLLVGRPTMVKASYDCSFVATSTNASIGIGFDGTISTTEKSSINQTGIGSWNSIRATQQMLAFPGVHYVQALEACIAGATATFYGINWLPNTNASPYGASSLLTVETKR